MVLTMIWVGAIAVVSVIIFIAYNAIMLERENQWLFTDRDRLMTERDELLYELHNAEERINFDRPNREPFDQERIPHFSEYRTRSERAGYVPGPNN